MLRNIARQLFRIAIRRWQALLIGILLLSLGLPLPTHSDSVPCVASTRLRIGDVARTVYNSADQPSTARPLRDFPGEEAPVLSSMPPGATLTVLHGPVCMRGVWWWEVQTMAGATGWTPEMTSDSPGNIYMLEPWQLLVDLTGPIPNGPNPTGLAIIRINVHGLARWLTTFTPLVLSNDDLDTFPSTEAGALLQAFAAAQQNCPDRVHLVDMSASEGLSAFPSPDSTRLLLVRHWWQTVAQCDGSTTPRYGVDRLSVVDSRGERLLFDLPAHSALSDLSSNPGADADPPNRVIDVRWSPDNLHALAWLRYGARSRLLLIDTVNGTSEFLDDGADPVWSSDGAWVSWLRADGEVTNLISDTPDRLSTEVDARQTLALPTTLQYRGAAFDPLWNADGTRLVACLRSDGCTSVMVIDVPLRHALPALTVPIHPPLAVRWVLGDSALLWLSRTDESLTVQPVTGGTPRTFALDLTVGERIKDVQAFPGGNAVLIVVQTANGRTRYVVLDLDNGLLTDVTFATP